MTSGGDICKALAYAGEADEREGRGVFDPRVFSAETHEVEGKTDDDRDTHDRNAVSRQTPHERRGDLRRSWGRPVGLGWT